MSWLNTPEALGRDADNYESNALDVEGLTYYSRTSRKPTRPVCVAEDRNRSMLLLVRHRQRAPAHCVHVQTRKEIAAHHLAERLLGSIVAHSHVHLIDAEGHKS